MDEASGRTLMLNMGEGDTRRAELRLNDKHSATRSLIDIVDDPVGDIVIKVGSGNNTCLVRAHKNVLIMSSPVFKTLLASQPPHVGQQPTYFEDDPLLPLANQPLHNVRLRIYTEEDPLLLQADDPTAFIDLCNILHQQAIGAQQVPLERLSAVVIVAYKYGCAERIRSSLSLPLHPIADLKADMSPFFRARFDTFDAVCIAYITGDCHLFTGATRRLIYAADGVLIDKRPSNRLNSLVPDSVFKKIVKNRVRALEMLDDVAYQPMVDIYKQTPLRNPCEEAIDAAGLLAFHMCKIKQGKRDFAMTTMSVEQALQAVASVAEIVGNPIGTIDVKTRLIEEANSIFRQTRGLCLECVKDRYHDCPLHSTWSGPGIVQAFWLNE